MQNDQTLTPRPVLVHKSVKRLMKSTGQDRRTLMRNLEHMSREGMLRFRVTDEIVSYVLLMPSAAKRLGL